MYSLASCVFVSPINCLQSQKLHEVCSAKGWQFYIQVSKTVVTSTTFTASDHLTALMEQTPQSSMKPDNPIPLGDVFHQYVTGILHQTEHFWAGFMWDPTSQLKAEEKSLEFCSVPITLEARKIF